MKILLAIPSKARHETLQKYSMQWLREFNSEIEWRVFVEPQDELEYTFVVPTINMVLLEKNDQGLGYVKSVIKKYAEENSYDLVFKLDDDIRSFTNFRAKHSPIDTAIYLEKLLPQFVAVFEKNKNIGAIAFPYSFEMYERIQWAKTKRLQTAYIVRTSLMFDNVNVSTFEDFATGLQCLVKGFAVMRYGLMGIDCGVKVGGGTGGLQKFDRHAMALKELDILRTIYPPLTFRAVDKPWKIEPDLSSVKL